MFVWSLVDGASLVTDHSESQLYLRPYWQSDGRPHFVGTSTEYTPYMTPRPLTNNLVVSLVTFLIIALLEIAATLVYMLARRQARRNDRVHVFTTHKVRTTDC